MLIFGREKSEVVLLAFLDPLTCSLSQFMATCFILYIYGDNWTAERRKVRNYSPNEALG